MREAGCGPPPAQPTDAATRPSHTPADFANRPLTLRTAPIRIALPTSSSMCPKRRRRNSDFCALARHGRAGTQKSELRRRRVGHGLGLGGGARLIGAVWGVHGPHSRVPTRVPTLFQRNIRHISRNIVILAGAAAYLVRSLVPAWSHMRPRTHLVSAAPMRSSKACTDKHDVERALGI